MAYTDIDRVNGYTIRKLHSPDKSKVFGYLSGKIDADKNLSEVMKHANLTEARNARGASKPVAKVTKPKSAYPQNQKGYDHTSYKG